MNANAKLIGVSLHQKGREKCLDFRFYFFVYIEINEHLKYISYSNLKLVIFSPCFSLFKLTLLHWFKN